MRSAPKTRRSRSSPRRRAARSTRTSTIGPSACSSPPTGWRTTSLEDEGDAAALANDAQLGEKRFRQRNAFLQAPLARRGLRIARYEHRRRWIDRRRAVQHVDHRIEVVLECAVGTEHLRVNGEEEVAQAVRVRRLLRLYADRRERRAG